ncbi:MAG: cobyric acid synthase [Thermodesulfovibrionales bacterium]
MAKALMIQGTGSGAGKSLIVAALCRIFKDMGINIAPFKAQNMALNSFITRDGGEIGRAQALQAEAARIEPSIDMNPVLLKASGERGCQVIVHGKVFGHYEAKKYYSLKESLWPYVKDSFDRLSEEYDLIIIEGAGSPAEINLMDSDIVNMRMAKYAKAPVLIVGDIDRGGVFASLYGTVRLLGRDSRYIKGFIINKFRGDIEILNPGLEMIREKTGKPVIGILPYIKDIGLPEEDGLALQKISIQSSAFSPQPSVKLVVVRLQYISNFTDFDPFIYEPDVELVYSNNPSDIENADIIIVPGTKNTVKDLLFLKERRLDDSIKRAYEKGIHIIGICGGYQILGKKIYDPCCVESSQKEIDGIGLLNIKTVFEKTKITAQVEAEIADSSWLMAQSYKPLKGYEIHMGMSTGDIGLFRIKRNGKGEVFDGTINSNCWGTYLHGIFENDEFRRAVINAARKNKNLAPIALKVRYAEIKDRGINALADVIRKNIDMDFIKRITAL